MSWNAVTAALDSAWCGNAATAGYFCLRAFGGCAATKATDRSIHSVDRFDGFVQSLGRLTYAAMGRSAGLKGPALSTANRLSRSVSKEA